MGKLYNDRYIPLHPLLKELLDDWITHHRPSGLSTNRLLLEHNRPISDHRIAKALRRLADTAGIGHSMGCLVVQKYLEKHHAPVVVLMAPSTPRGIRRVTLRMVRRHPRAVLRANTIGSSRRPAGDNDTDF
jgi:integrase